MENCLYMLAESKQTSFCRKITCPMLFWSAWANIAQGNYLFNVGPQSRNNFSQKNNTQYCLGLPGPTLCMTITYVCVMWAHSPQTTFHMLSGSVWTIIAQENYLLNLGSQLTWLPFMKIIYTMLWQSCWDNMAYKYCLLNT